MKPAGMREVEAARSDGRWAAAYDSPRDAQVPADFMAMLANNSKARSCFETLSRANLYAITYRLQTARRPETGERRMQAMVKMLACGRTFH